MQSALRMRASSLEMASSFAFTAAYAAFPPLIGTAIDRFGVKRSLAVALVLWSLASAAHGLVATVHTIEIANGNAAALMDLQNTPNVPINFHWRGKCLSWHMGSRSKDLYIQRYSPLLIRTLRAIIKMP